MAQGHLREESIQYVGPDVHGDTIAVAISEGRGEVRTLGDDPESAGADSKAGEEAGAGFHAAGVLQGGSAGVCALLAACTPSIG